MIREQAREIASNLEIPVDDFKFSNGWLWVFKKRYNIHVLQDHGEAGSCDPNDVSRRRLECQGTIMQFNRSDVHNLDETALNYCSHTRRSHQRPGTKKSMLALPSCVIYCHMLTFCFDAIRSEAKQVAHYCDARHQRRRDGQAAPHTLWDSQRNRSASKGNVHLTTASTTMQIRRAR